VATLEVRSVWRTYPGERVALTDASFAVGEGRICAILGPSGSGKTTLLRLIAGLDRPDAGDVLLDGVSITGHPPHRRGLGLMFQDLALFPNMSVHDNVAFGLRMVGWPRAEREQRVNDLLEVVGLTSVGRRRIDQLSRAEQQRVALARTLAPQPSVLLLDEPFGTMDEVQKSGLRLELRSILNALETTTVIASHELNDAVAMADELVVMNEGRVLQSGATGTVLGEPASVEVAELAGYVTLALGPVRRGRVEEAGAGAMAVPGLTETDAARVMAHPSSLLAVPAESGLGSGVAGLVLRTRAQGPTWLVDLAVGTRIVETRWEWDLAPPRTGMRLAIAARPGTLRVFITSLATLPAPSAPTAPEPPAPAPPGPSSSPPSPDGAATGAPDGIPEEPPASAMPPGSSSRAMAGPSRSAAPEPPVPVTRREQRHRQMPLS